MFFSLWMLHTFIQCILIIATWYHIHLPPTPPSALHPSPSQLQVLFLLFLLISTRSISSACMCYGYVALHCNMGHLPWAVSPKESDSCFLSSHWSPSPLIRSNPPPTTVHPVILLVAGRHYRPLGKTPWKKKHLILAPVSGLGPRTAAALLWV